MSGRVLYFGLRCPAEADVVHCPLIACHALELPSQELISSCSHAIFSSRSSVEILAGQREFRHLKCLAVGQATGQALRDHGVTDVRCAHPETAEGLCLLLDEVPPQARIFYPHSVRSRPVIAQHLDTLRLWYQAWPLYDTVTTCPRPLPDLADFTVLRFTSPSTVAAFQECYGAIPTHCKVEAIGPITQAALRALQ